VRHGASDHVSGDRPGGARPAMMAADRLHAGRDYAWRGARRIILRSVDIAVRNTPAAGRWVRACAFVTSDGIGGTDGFGGAVPLFVTSDGIGGAVRLFVTSDGIGGTDGFGGAVPLGDGRGRVVAGLGSGWGATGSGMVSSLGTWGPPQHHLPPLVSGRPERCAGEWVGGRPLAALRPRRRWHSSCHRRRPAGSWPGSFHQAPARSAGTRHCERHGHQRS
jgi:hypothetical protein